MKRIFIQILSVTAIMLLTAGCGSRDKKSSAEETSAIRPKEAVTAEETRTTEGNPAAETVSGGDETQDTYANETAASKADALQSGLLSEEEARNIALNDAGVTEQEVSGIRIKLETEHGVQEYEVDFYAGNAEYDYDIDAVTGDIRSKDMDIDYDFSYTETSGAEISEEEAKVLALSKVPGAAESNIRIHRDYDDGRAIYEGSIIYNNKEYDLEIDANSGKIVEWEEEYD